MKEIYLEGGYKINLEENTSKKSNFKLILSLFVDNFSEIFQGKVNNFITEVRFYISKSIEKREKFKRSYERRIKKSQRPYHVTFTPRRGLN